jgi:hypothetical protein
MTQLHFSENPTPVELKNAVITLCEMQNRSRELIEGLQSDARSLKERIDDLERKATTGLR